MGYKHIFLVNGKIEINPNEMPIHVYSDNPDWFNSNQYINSIAYREWLRDLKVIKFHHSYDSYQTTQSILKDNLFQKKTQSELDLLFKTGIDVSGKIELEYDGHYENIVAKFKEPATDSLNVVLDNMKEVEYNLCSNNNIEETQEQMLYDIELFIRRENGNDTEMAMNIIKEIRHAFILKRNEIQD